METKSTIPRHVLMTADTIGGVWTYSLDLIRELRQRDISVSLATMGHVLTPAQRVEVSKLKLAHFFESNFDLEWMESPWRDIEKASEWLQNIEEKIHPDLIHFNQFCFSALPWKVPYLTVAHSDIYSWYHAVRFSEPEASWKIYFAKVKKALEASPLIVAPSQSYLDTICKIYGPFDEKKVKVIRNSRSIPLQPLSPKEDFVLSVGRLWDEAKNILALNAVAPSLPWPIYVAGDVKAPRESRVIQLPVLKTLGKLTSPDLSTYYAKASIYSLPALYEPFGLSILEAASAGCALVLGDIPSLRENWEGAAQFVSPTDPDALKEAILEMIINLSAREKLSKEAYIRSTQFKISAMVENYISTYGQVIDSFKSTTANKEKGQTQCA
jgi:glycogen(starch) synthase